MTLRSSFLLLASAASALGLACSSAASSDEAMGLPSGNPGGNVGNVTTGGAQDFALFRRALDEGRVPPTDSLDAAGFFAEHYTSLPAPTCGKTFCLHGMLSISPDLARSGTWTLLQMGMNSTIDPATVTKPPLELAVVLDRSGSMTAGGKLDYAKTGVELLVDSLGETDRLTLITFDDGVQTIHSGLVIDKTALKAKIAAISPGGSTNLYDSLQAGYRAIEGANEQLTRRVIFLTDGQPTAGNTDPAAIAAMSAGYNEKHLGVTTIGLGTDVSTSLLRGLAEKGGGNFYYLEKPEAVKEVFTEELKFFVAPLAYDLELSYSELPSYSTKEVFGSNLWKDNKVFIPSVFLTSRTSTAPNPTGGRRGGGSAIIADLLAKGELTGASQDVGRITLKYRLPGSSTFESQEVTVNHDGSVPEGGYYSSDSIEKNTLILSFFVAFRDATLVAQTNRAAARTQLTTFQSKIVPRLAGITDEDLVDDLKILQRYIDVLR